MRVRCIDNRAILSAGPDGLLRPPEPGEFLSISLTVGKIYEVLAEEDDMYQLVDDTGDDYLFPKEMFAVVDE
jgi:hypothetical protein